MDYPPWLPKPEHSRRGMLLALARCIYEVWYKHMKRSDKGEIWTFDNLCTGELERVASVLVRTGFTRYIDYGGRFSVFNVGPDDFEGLADAAANAPVADEEIAEAVVKMVEEGYGTNLEIKKLAEMIANRS